MALEDEYIDSDKLEIADEIKIGDYIFLETTEGTKLIDFGNFIIGADNVTFFDKISGTYLQVADVSAISAKTLNNESILSSISGVNTDLENLETRINSVEDSVISFVNSIDSSAISASDITQFTNASIGFTVSGPAKAGGLNTFEGFTFSTTEFKGSSLTNGVDLILGDGSNSFSYTAKGSYSLLILGSFTLTDWTAPRQSYGAIKNAYIVLKKNTNTVIQETINSSEVSVGQPLGTCSFVAYVNLTEGDILTISSNTNIRKMTGRLTGLKVS